MKPLAEAPLISIIMPAYNAAKFINHSIKSVVDQTYQNWELIVINDGSKDDTAKIVEDRARQDKRIILINQTNKKQAGARNAGLEVIKGDWVAFLDADDVWMPHKLEFQLALTGQSDAGLLYSTGYYVDETFTVTGEYKTLTGAFTGEEIYEPLFRENLVPILSVMVKRDWILKIGPQDEEPNMVSCEDWDYWLRLARAGCKFLGVDEPLFYYRRHENNMSGNGEKLQIAQVSVMIKNYDKELDEANAEKFYLLNLVEPLITRLITVGKVNESVFLMRGLAKVFPSGWYNQRIALTRLLGRRALYPVRAIAKLNRVLT